MRNRARSALALYGPIPVLVLLAAGWARGTVPPASVVRATEIAVGCSKCSWCLNGHEAPPGSDQNGIHDYCIPLADCNGHGPCSPESPIGLLETQVMELVDQFVDSGDEEALYRMLSDFPEKAVLNLERRAVQITGCDGELVAHLPLEHSVLDRAVSASLLQFD